MTEMKVHARIEIRTRLCECGVLLHFALGWDGQGSIQEFSWSRSLKAMKGTQVALWTSSGSGDCIGRFYFQCAKCNKRLLVSTFKVSRVIDYSDPKWYIELASYMNPKVPAGKTGEGRTDAAA